MSPICPVPLNPYRKNLSRVTVFKRLYSKVPRIQSRDAVLLGILRKQSPPAWSFLIELLPYSFPIYQHHYHSLPITTL